MGKYLDILESLRKEGKVRIEESKVSRVSFDIMVDKSEDPQDIMNTLNDYYAEGNNLFDHIESSKLGGKRVITVLYNLKKDGRASERWALSLKKKLEKEEGWKIEYTVN